MAAQNNARSAWLPICFRWSFVILLFLTMVVPNSIKPVSVSFLALTAALGWPLTNFSPAFMRVVWMHGASSAVTLLYLVVGLVNGASNEALLQTLFIYIVSPALWILVAGGVLATFESDSLERMMENNAIFGAASVGLFFYLFLNGGPEAVSFFIEPENANVNLVDGYSGATMHVYGTLLFMSSAMFAMLAVGEMGTKLPNPAGKDLYAFWRERITATLNEALADDPHPVLVNLASDEYFSAVDVKRLEHPVLKIAFEEWRDDARSPEGGKWKVVSFNAKRARGMMTRYAIDIDAKKPADLRGFDRDGYALDEAASSDDRWVFRRRDWPPAK